MPGMGTDWEGESPSTNRMEVKVSEAQGYHSDVGLKEAWSKSASQRTDTGYQAPGPDEWA